MATNNNTNGHDGLDITILKEISEKTSSIQTSINYHNDRLTKIEEAILQLATTSERVKAMDSGIREIKSRQENFETEVWSVFDKVRENESLYLEGRASTELHFENHDKRIDKVEVWKDIVSNEIQSNSRVRKWVDKGMYFIIIFIILGVMGSYFAFSRQNPTTAQLEKIERLIIQHNNVNLNKNMTIKPHESFELHRP